MSVQYDGLDVESIVNDISRWTEDRARKIDEAGKRIQEEMIPEVSAVTPVRQRGGPEAGHRHNRNTRKKR